MDNSIQRAINAAYIELDSISTAAEKAYKDGLMNIYNTLDNVWFAKWNELNRIIAIINRA